MLIKPKEVSEKLFEKVIRLYGCDDWLYIKHPNLGYICPLVYTKTHGEVEVEDLIDKETLEFIRIDKKLEKLKNNENCKKD